MLPFNKRKKERKKERKKRKKRKMEATEHTPFIKYIKPKAGQEYIYRPSYIFISVLCMIGMYYLNLYFAKPSDDTPMSEMYKHYWLIGPSILFMIIGLISSFFKIDVMTKPWRTMLGITVGGGLIWGVTSLFMYADNPHQFSGVTGASAPSIILSVGILLMSHGWRKLKPAT
jgi:peptidoglycan/LPS O-acetylase OafA/YrhL